MSTYTDLLAKVEAATGIDRALDAEIAKAFGWHMDGKFQCWMKPKEWTAVEVFEALPHFTGSMSTAAALVAFVRPAPVYVGIGFTGLEQRGRAHIGKRDWVTAPSPPLAILVALFKLLVADELLTVEHQA